MTFEEIERRIELGEDSSLEFKSLSASPSRVLSPDSRDVADEIAAAANASGATFLLVSTCLSRCPLPEGLTDVMRSRIMDRRGEGVPVIYSATRKLAGKSPIYRLLDDSELMLTIFSAPIDDRAALKEIANGLSRETSGWLTDGLQIESIKKLLRANPKMTQVQLAQNLGLSRTSVANWIRKAGGSIRRVGSPNGGRWKVDA